MAGQQSCHGGIHAPAMQPTIAPSFFDENASPSSTMLRKNVKSDDVLERIVLDVTLVSDSDTLNAHCAVNHSGRHCVRTVCHVSVCYWGGVSIILSAFNSGCAGPSYLGLEAVRCALWWLCVCQGLQ